MPESKNTVKIECGRCGGKGKVWFSRACGSVCFSCNGLGYHMITKKAFHAKEKAMVAKAEKLAIMREKSIQKSLENETKMKELIKKYQGDPRIKPDTYRYEMRLWEVVMLIDKFERGEIKEWMSHWG